MGKIHVVYLPLHGPKGLDDVFAAGSSVDDLKAYATTTLHPLPAVGLNGHHTATPPAAPAPTPTPQPPAAPRANGTVRQPFVGPATRVMINVGANSDLKELRRQALDALSAANKDAQVLRYGNQLVWTVPTDDGGAAVQVLGEDHLRHVLAEVALFTRLGPGGVRNVMPPTELIRDLLAVPPDDLPVLTRLVEVPVLTPDGTIHDQPGYHPTGVYYAPAPGLTLKPIPAEPSPAEILAARETLTDDLLGDFRFKGKADRAHAVALIVTTAVRDYIRTAVPVTMFKAHIAGSGKGLCAGVCLGIALGTVPSMPEAHDDDEWRKRLTSALRRSAPAIKIDNVRGVLDSGSLASALTEPVWNDRLLGTNQEVIVPIRSIFVITANNPTMTTEIARRIVSCTIDPGVERPWERKPESFRHADLRIYADEHRAKLMHATLVLVQAWLAAGKPSFTKKPLGSYEEWAKVVGGVLQVAGVDGFLENMSEFYEAADIEGETLREFVLAWWDRWGDKQVGAADLFPLADPIDGFDLPGDTERARRTAFGMYLSKHRDRVVADYRIVKGGVTQRAQQWRLLPTTPPTDDRVNLVNLCEPFTPPPIENFRSSGGQEVHLGSLGSPTARAAPEPPWDAPTAYLSWDAALDAAEAVGADWLAAPWLAARAVGDAALNARSMVDLAKARDDLRRLIAVARLGTWVWRVAGGEWQPPPVQVVAVSSTVNGVQGVELSDGNYWPLGRIDIATPDAIAVWEASEASRASADEGGIEPSEPSDDPTPGGDVR